MTDPLSHLAQRVQAARLSRMAVRDRAAHTVQRLNPPRLAQDAVEAAKNLAEETGQQVRGHPFTAAGVVVATLALIFHKPLGRFAEQLADRWLPLDDEPAYADEEPASDSFHSADDPHPNSPSPTEHDHDRTLD